MAKESERMSALSELNLGQLLKAITARVPDRPAILAGNQALSYAELLQRSSRLARFLRDRGIGHFADRSELHGYEAGQHLLAQYLHNGPEYIEGLLGSYLARAAPFNVNYRYQADELRYLFRDAAPAVIQFHATFAPLLAQIIDELPSVQVLLQVDDGSGHPLLPGAIDYENALASVPADVNELLSPDDLYVIYTGGTTGMPKGVLWRQGDVAVATMGVRNRRAGREWSSVDECVDAVRPEPTRLLPCAPLMHGAAQWGGLQTLCEGNTLVFPEHPESFSAADILAAVQRHQVTVITFVGDAFGWPLVEELESGKYDVSSLRVIVSGGAAWHVTCKQRLLDLVPGLRVVESIGSSESGVLGSRENDAVAAPAGSTFIPDDSLVVVSQDFSRILERGHEGIGWLARRGRIPLGYLGDPDKTARTFPVIEGVRLSLPGDRARLLQTGEVQLLGRDSHTVNTGGEKVFVEEVEAAIKDHPAVSDALVCGRPSARWGSEIAALVVSSGIDHAALVEFCRRRLARYKVPKAFYFVERIHRNPAGKPDYQWAAHMVQQPALAAESDNSSQREVACHSTEGSFSND
jgi:3-oxocholest-4-en-26-oate---CoA ligase